MKIEEYIEIAKTKKEIDGVSLVKTETLEYKQKTAPEGYEEVVRWSFSDGTIIRFENETDTEAGWKAHNRCWRFESIGVKVSNDSSVGVVSTSGLV